jgi:starch synthase
VVTTVSPTYAREILTPEFGMALDGLLRTRSRTVHGILNGVDDSVWNPAADPALPQNFGATRIDLRARNKTTLQAKLGLTPSEDRPLFAVVSRLSQQKGLDLLLQALPALIAKGAQLALLGSGERTLEVGFAEAAAVQAGSVGCVFGYDERLAHLFQGAADFILVPSRFEPCGLTQLCALRYGATPIVSRVGGLADTIIDANEAAIAAGVATGMQFSPLSVEALNYALDRALAVYRDPTTMRRMRLNGMRADVSWRGPARRYAALYRSIAAPAAA